MTEPVILYGTQSNGETLPVQVNATGQLVAEGLQGNQGPPGPPGQNGADGGDFPLPADPYEGALLGWLNGGLAWIGTPPVPIPPGIYGPIIAWDPDNSLLTLGNPLDESINTGVYIEQCSIDGTVSAPDPDWNVEQEWSSLVVGGAFNPSFPATNAFNGNANQSCLSTSTFTIDNLGLIDVATLDIYLGNGSASNDIMIVQINGGAEYQVQGIDANLKNNPLQLTDVGVLSSIQIRRQTGTFCGLYRIKVNGKELVDRSLGVIQARVNQRLSDTELLVVPLSSNQFVVDQFVKVPGQRIAPWVLYGNDPTTRIDYLRQTRD